jgi:hypothetical protein
VTTLPAVYGIPLLQAATPAQLPVVGGVVVGGVVVGGLVVVVGVVTGGVVIGREVVVVVGG